jgi:hypothetical protein
LASAAAAAAAAAVAYLALFHYQLGALLPAEYWIRDCIHVKEHLAEQSEGQARIFVIGGSGALFGVDCSMVQEQLGIRTINLATHGGLRFDFITRLARRVAKPGDTILALLEPTFVMLQNSKPWFFHNIMCWDPAYFHDLPIHGKLRFVASVNPDRVLAGGLTRSFEQRIPEGVRHLRSLTRDQLVRHVNELWAADAPPTATGYAYHNLDRNGDIRVDESIEVPFKHFYNGYLVGMTELRPGFVREYKCFVDDMREKGVRVKLFWPATMKDERFDLSRVADREVVAAVTRSFAEHHIEIIGSVLDAHYPRRYFYDSNFHLNSRGREIHTRRLLKLIKTHVPELQAHGRL